MCETPLILPKQKPVAPKPVAKPYKKAGFLHYSLLALLIGIAFGALFRSEIVWTEYDQVSRSQFTEMSALSEAWTLDSIRSNDPITISSYFLEQKLPLPLHISHRAINLLLHFIAAALFLQILQAFKLPGAFLATLLFALHPSAVQTLFWAGYRNEIVGLICILTALYFGIRQKNRLDWLYFFILGCVAILIHPSAFLLPIIVAGVIFLKGKKTHLEDFNPVLPLLLACIFIGIWINPNLQGYPPNIDFSERAYYFSQSFYFHLRQTFIPISLDLFYPAALVEAQGQRGTMSLLPFLLFIPFYILIIYNIRKRWSRAFGLGMTTFLLALFYGLLQSGRFLDQTIALEDHTLYIALPPIFALCVTGLISLANKTDLSVQYLMRIAITLVVLFAGLISAAFTYQISDTPKMWERLASQWPTSWVPQTAYIETALTSDPPLITKQEAIALRENLLEKNPDLIEVRKDLAFGYTEEGELTNAINEYNRLLREPIMDRAFLQEAITFYQRMGLNREAENARRRLSQLPPE